MKKFTPILLIAIFCVSLMIPLTAMPMGSENISIITDSVSIPATEGDEGHQLRIPVYEDETVENSTPDGTRHGNEYWGGLFVGMETEESILGRSFFKFDLRDIPIALGYQSAYLYVHLNNEYTTYDDQDLPIGVHYVSNDSWSEETITWNNQPSHSSTATDIIDSPASPDMFKSGNYYAWDVTSDVDTALAGDRILSEMLKISDEVNPSSCWKYFTEYEYADFNSSYLAIEYNEPVIDNLEVNGHNTQPHTDYIEPPGVLTWDVLGDGPDEQLSNYDLEIYADAAGDPIYEDSNIQHHSIYTSGGSGVVRPFGTADEMRFQFKWGDDLVTRSGLVDRLYFRVGLESGMIEFENISIFMLNVNFSDALSADFEANYNGSVPTQVFYRDFYQAQVSDWYVSFDIDNIFFMNEKTSPLVEFRWEDMLSPTYNTLYGTGESGSVAYSYGGGATVDGTADYTLARTYRLKVDFISEVVSSDGSGVNGYPFASVSQGAFQFKYNKSLISETGTIDKLYFGVDDFNGMPILNDLRIWIGETSIEGALGTTFADNYGALSPIQVMNEATYEPRNLGYILEFDVDDIFEYSGEYDLIVELRFGSKSGTNLWATRDLSGGGGYRCGNTGDDTAPNALFTDEITYDLEISFARNDPRELPDVLDEGQYYYARIRPCDTTGVWGDWSDLLGFKFDIVQEVTESKIRVAIYDEGNTTSPDWTTSAGVVNNNATGMQDILRSYGYDVTLLTTADIENHELMTVDYDVFVMVDNLPRESIVNYVKEYYLGGGGILALDGSAQFLCYIGALPPEAVGTDGFSEYWSYTANDFNITEIHPVSRSYSLSEVIITGAGYFAWNTTALNESAIADQITVFGRKTTDQNFTSTLAFNPTDLGGKVVTLGVDLVSIDSQDFYPMFADAVEWLAPKPKARIAYDFSHRPYYCVDTWDTELSVYSTNSRHSDLRDELVSRGYTFDKFYPDVEENFTSDRLSGYDLIIISAPHYNLSSIEVDALKAWIENGGSLILNGEWASFDEVNTVVNTMLAEIEIDIELFVGDEFGTSQLVEYYDHPTIEDVIEIQHSGGSFVNITGDAVPLTHLGVDLCSAAQDVDEGRVYVSGDINTISNFLDHSDNTQYVVNLFNWLTASEAEVLVFADSTAQADPNDNIYKGHVASALNTLGVDFYITTNRTYFEKNLDWYDWDMIAVDSLEYSLSSDSYSELLEYMESGGKLVVSSKSVVSSHSIWDYLGVSEASSILTPPEQYIWDSTHPIFKTPIDFGASSLTSTSEISFSLTAANLSLYENATGLAGTTVGASSINVGIAEGANGNAIINGMLLTLYNDDNDLSGYADGFEIWLNELAYMLKPSINSPSDIIFEVGETGNEFTWTPSSSLPWLFSLEIDSVENDSGFWYGEPFFFDVDEYPVGEHSFILTVWDQRGEAATDEVIVTVAMDLTDPIIDSPADVIYTEGETGNNITWTASDSYQDEYLIMVNGTTLSGYPAEWNTTSILVDVDGLSIGVYNYTIVVFDEYGHSASDEVIVTVLEDTTTSTTTTTTTTTDTSTTDTNTTTPPPVDPTLIIIIVVAAGAVVAIIVVILLMKKRKG